VDFKRVEVWVPLLPDAVAVILMLVRYHGQINPSAGGLMQMIDDVLYRLAVTEKMVRTRLEAAVDQDVDRIATLPGWEG
jgi:hypothetical protein